jgi:hypothetical protein
MTTKYQISDPEFTPCEGGQDQSGRLCSVDRANKRLEDRIDEPVSLQDLERRLAGRRLGLTVQFRETWR